MTRTTWIIFAAICALLLGGLIWNARSNQTNVDDINVSTIQPASAENGEIGDHVYGNADSKVVIYEYGDYECPACAGAAPAIKQAAEKYKDKVALVFRNFPLSSIHPNARAAAAVAEAAGLQDKYWEMHDFLYDNQSSWSSLGGSERTDTFTQYAEGLGLDTAKFATDLESSAVTAKINYDQALARKLSLSATPTVFINDKQVDGYEKDGKLVTSADDGANSLFSSADIFEKLVILPALKDAGISVE